MTGNSKKRMPNILLIQADQMAAPALPVYGHPSVKTPNLDEMAENGVVFENTYCNFPLCTPSRMSMLTGRYANSVNVWDNASEMASCEPTIPHYLRHIGYETTLCGKMHFVGPDQLHGYENRITTDIYPSNYAWAPDWREGAHNRPTGINLGAVIGAGKCVRSLQIDYDDEVEYAGVQEIYDLARYSGDNPFFLTVSFTHPHSPYIIQEKYWDRYNHDEIDMPAVPPIPVEEMDALSRWIHYAHGGDLNTVTEEHVRNARHAYYGMISYIDDKVGNVIRVLRETGQDENTIVVFTSDHGDMMGERGQWYKQTFFEWSARVPLIVSSPNRFQPRRVNRLVSLVDLLPTFLDWATDGQPPELAVPIDGYSLTKLLTTGEDTDRPNQVISEYTGEGTCAPCRMVRRAAYKYIYTHGHSGMLFNMDKDPLELKNLADSAETAQLEQDLRSEVLKDWDPEAITGEIMDSQKKRLFVKAAMAGNPTWAHVARLGDDMRFVRNEGAVQTKAKARFPYVEPITPDK